MPNMLRFETVLKDGLELPVLVDANFIDIDTPPNALSVDGARCEIDDSTLQTFVSVITKMKYEQLPEGHFRDCAHFVMAMCGLWMPTHKPFDARSTMVYECDNSALSGTALRGPVMMGIPNDDRCLGFGDVRFVYSHSGYVVSTTLGEMCFHKLDIQSDYAFSTVESTQEAYRNEVTHPLDALWVVDNDQEVFKWSRQEAILLCSED